MDRVSVSAPAQEEKKRAMEPMHQIRNLKLPSSASNFPTSVVRE